MEKINDSQRKLLDAYLTEILRINQTLNITRVTDYEAAQLLHIEDSLQILQEYNNAPEGQYIDLGSGGGFPGVPLAIMTQRETTLIDSVTKKMVAVQEILDDLHLSHFIHTSSQRIEDHSIKNRETYSVATARAVSSIPALLELASPLLQQGGQLILMKSKEQEGYNKETALNKLGMKQISFREYYLSDGETYRTVSVFEKIAQPSVTLPRRIGMAQKRPLAAQ